MTSNSATALITGASSGIGAELGRIHAEHKGNLVLVARRLDRLEALKSELEQAHGITVHAIAKDLTDPEAPREIYGELIARNIQIDYLINSAGLGNVGLFHEQDWARNEAMIKVNVLALAALTRLFTPAMVTRGNGRILNVASMAGFLPGPLHAVYYATKAFVVSFSEATSNELAGTGVTVTALCPGPVETEFLELANLKYVSDFAPTISAQRVARTGYEAMLKGKTIIVPGLMNKLITHVLLRLTPRKQATAISRSLIAKKT